MEIMPHDHNTSTCETCKSVDDYCKEQYARYESSLAHEQARSRRLKEALNITLGFLPSFKEQSGMRQLLTGEWVDARTYVMEALDLTAGEKGI